MHRDMRNKSYWIKDCDWMIYNTKRHQRTLKWVRTTMEWYCRYEHHIDEETYKTQIDIGLDVP